ncbi:hypothetical protein AB0G04_00885 [Actinoplanes sp. NPDC023801]|uniref:hypothetical protein n=1 Tax=Actinoplanes sp. NPDC023801 TaxID=3154595 RepID=UPI0033FB033D
MFEDLRADISRAADRMGSAIGAKKELNDLADHLAPGENVAALVAGSHGPGNGLLVLTDSRVLFLFEGLIRKAFVDIKIPDITAVRWETAVNLGTITLLAGGEVSISGVDKDGGAFFVEALEAARSARR